jgi:hypothetical protein
MIRHTLSVIPAKAGIQTAVQLDPGLRRDDDSGTGRRR